jgi:hypothetical protein
VEVGKLKILEERMLRGKFESVKEEIPGGCRKMHTEEDYIL